MWLTSLVLFIFLQMVIALRGKHAPCDNIEIVRREDWRARPSVRSKAVKLPLLQVIIQHTVTPPCKTKAQCIRNVQFIQDYHLDYKGWGDIAYNFLIGGDGRVYEGVGWNDEGAHSINFNWKSLGIAFMGNFMEVTPNQKMLDAALNLIKCGVKEGYLAPTYELTGQRNITCTSSPDDKLYKIIRQQYSYKIELLSLYDCSGEIEAYVCSMDFGYLAPTYELTGHRDVACTLSPGDKLYEIIRQRNNYKGGRLTSYDCSGN